MTATTTRRMRPLARAAAFATITAAALPCLAGLAQAQTLTNSSLIQLGQYPIPATAPFSYAGQSSALPTTGGALGQPTEIMVGDGSVNQALTIPNGTTQWGTQLVTAPATGASSQTWYFQRIGTIGLTTPSIGSYSIDGGPGYDLANVYKVINYNPNGSHTCLDGYSDNPGAGSVVDSYGCDPNQVNQTNQLWVVGNSSGSDLVVGSQGESSSIYTSSTYSTTLAANSVIENVATLQAAGWVTNSAPVLAADTADILGESSPVTLADQTFPARDADATWSVNDIAPAAPAAPTPPPAPPVCYGYLGCLV